MRTHVNGRVAGKVAIVSGAGSRGDGIGNGRAAAILLARHGARVALIDNSVEWARTTERMIADEGGESFVITADVTKADDCRAAVQATVERWQSVNVLVNNVGIMGPPGTAVDVDLDAWDAAMRVNLTTMILMTRYAVPEMKRSGGGAIVNISSVAGLFGGHPGLFYPTSKGAIPNMTRAMAAHHGPDGIRVNCVAPGSVYTPMVSIGGMSEALREERRINNLLHTEGTGWDIGNAVLFLASDESRWVTGVTLPVDAGYTSGMPFTPGPATA